jgi:hypothetical protein
LSQGLSAFQDVPNQAEDGISFPWPGNLVICYQDRFFQGTYRLISAWQEISKSQIAEMLDNVRNRTLNMALQIKDELGTSYTELRKIESKEKEASIQNIIFQNTGGNTNVAFGQGNVDASGQVHVVITPGDRNALDQVLVRAGLELAALEKLTEAIQKDGGQKPGSKVAEWVKANAGKVLSGGVKVGVSIGQQLLTEWLKQHYGIH